MASSPDDIKLRCISSHRSFCSYVSDDFDHDGAGLGIIGQFAVPDGEECHAPRPLRAIFIGDPSQMMAIEEELRTAAISHSAIPLESRKAGDFEAAIDIMLDLDGQVLFEPDVIFVYRPDGIPGRESLHVRDLLRLVKNDIRLRHSTIVWTNWGWMSRITVLESEELGVNLLDVPSSSEIRARAFEEITGRLAPRIFPKEECLDIYIESIDEDKAYIELADVA